MTKEQLQDFILQGKDTKSIYTGDIDPETHYKNKGEGGPQE